MNQKVSNFAQLQSDKVKDPDVIVHRFEDKKGNRFYYDLNEDGSVRIFSGVTSWISQVMPESPFMTDWKVKHGIDWRNVLSVYSGYGTLMHMIFADWFNGRLHLDDLLSQAQDFCSENKVSPDMPRKDLLSFIRWVEDFEVEPLVIEGMALSAPIDGEHFCMTLDMLAYITIQEKAKEMVKTGVYQIGPKKGQDKMEEKTVYTPKRVLALIDFKSNFAGKEDHKSYFDSHKYQLIAAKDAVKYNFGVDVDVIANLSPLNWKDEPTYQFTMHNIEQNDYEIYRTYMNLARMRGLFTPSGKILVIEQYENSKDFKYMSYQDYIPYYINKQNKPKQPQEIHV